MTQINDSLPQKSENYIKLIKDIYFKDNLALRVKRNVLGIFKETSVKSLDELGKLLHKLENSFTEEQSKEFILELMKSTHGWNYKTTRDFSDKGYDHYLLFKNSEDGNVEISKIKRRWYAEGFGAPSI